MRVRDDGVMSRIVVVFAHVIVVVGLSGAGASADAAGYCRPTSAGKDRIIKTGTCPTGYFASGGCCEAFHRETKQAFPRLPGKACPAGSYASGGACVSFR